MPRSNSTSQVVQSRLASATDTANSSRFAVAAMLAAMTQSATGAMVNSTRFCFNVALSTISVPFQIGYSSFNGTAPVILANCSYALTQAPCNTSFTTQAIRNICDGSSQFPIARAELLANSNLTVSNATSDRMFDCFGTVCVNPLPKSAFDVRIAIAIMGGASIVVLICLLSYCLYSARRPLRSCLEDAGGRAEEWLERVKDKSTYARVSLSKLISGTRSSPDELEGATELTRLNVDGQEGTRYTAP